MNFNDIFVCVAIVTTCVAFGLFALGHRAHRRTYPQPLRYAPIPRDTERYDHLAWRDTVSGGNVL